MTIEAMKQALEFLEAGDFVYPSQIAVDLRAAIAEVEKQDDYKRGFSDGQKEFAEISGGEWQMEVIDQLVIHHAYQKKHDIDPAKAVHDLLCVSNGLAIESTEKQEPLFWYRPVGVGEMYEGPVHHRSVGGKMMRDERPGEWIPLYAVPQHCPRHQ